MSLKSCLFAFAVVLALLGAACSGDSDEDITPTTAATVPGTIVRPAGSTAVPAPTPTLGIAPEATPTRTPIASPEEQARSLSLVEAPAGMLEFVTSGPYVVPGDALGVFYLDIETQEIRGWYDLIGGQSPTFPVAFSGENRFTLFERHEQTFVGGLIYPAGLYLGDKATGRVYRWEGDAEPAYETTAFNGSEIAARGDLVLFRVPVEDGDDWFSLLNVESGEVEAAFEAEGALALIAEDASKIALVAAENEFPDLSVVDIASGDVARIGEVGLQYLDLEGLNELIDGGDGETFVFVSTPAKSRFTGIASRYTWGGTKVSSIEGWKVFASPHGDYVATLEPVVDAENDFIAQWYVFHAFEMTDGASPTFRVVGTTPYYGFWAGNRWLADGSGLVVERPDGELVIAMRDGSFEEFVGVPSPDSPEVFGIYGGAVDPDGEPIIELTFQGGIRDFVNPWGDSGDEVRILIPALGHGGPGLFATITEPYIEDAPYDTELQLELSQIAVAFGLLNLYDKPGGDMVVGQVGAPYRVSVHEVVLRCSGSASESDECPKVDTELPRDFIALVLGQEIPSDAPITSHWARVTTEEGREGWILLRAQAQGA